MITFLDLTKTFDTVNHKILLDKLNDSAIRGHAHKACDRYLSNRQHRVKINKIYCDFKEVISEMNEYLKQIDV